jgi:hypothetical protein
MRAKLREWPWLFLAAGYALGFVGLAQLLPDEQAWPVGVLLVWTVGYPFACVTLGDRNYQAKEDS